jgi:hypothetical protein
LTASIIHSLLKALGTLSKSIILPIPNQSLTNLISETQPSVTTDFRQAIQQGTISKREQDGVNALSIALAAVTINKLLICTERRVMHFLLVRDQQESITEFRVQAFWLVSHHRQTTAFFRAIRGKGGHNHMTTRADCMHDPLDISVAVSRVSQKMEHRTVMPNIKAVLGKLCAGNIAFHPVHSVRLFSQTLLCDRQRR